MKITSEEMNNFVKKVIARRYGFNPDFESDMVKFEIVINDGVDVENLKNYLRQAGMLDEDDDD